MASFSEGILLSEKVGLDPNVLVEVFCTCDCQSQALIACFFSLIILICILAGSCTGCYKCTHVLYQRPVHGAIHISYCISFETSTEGLLSSHFLETRVNKWSIRYLFGPTNCICGALMVVSHLNGFLAADVIYLKMFSIIRSVSSNFPLLKCGSLAVIVQFQALDWIAQYIKWGSI